MTFIQELQLTNITNELTSIYENIITAGVVLKYLTEDANIPEVPTDLIDNLKKIMDDAVSKYSAARRALSIVGRLKPGPDRQKHTKHILASLNKLRAYNQRINKAVEKLSVREDQEHDFANLLIESTMEYKDLDKHAQAVWTASGDAKKAALIKMINSFKFKGKQESHIAKAEAMTSSTKMDSFAADLMQVGHGNKVIK